jgi:mRNA interferase HigB
MLVFRMQVVALRTLKRFWSKHARAEPLLRDWHFVVRNAEWRTPQDVKTSFGNTVDFVADNRAIFDIGGNNYRIVAHISYKYKSVLVKFIGTHKEYDKINPETI